MFEFIDETSERLGTPLNRRTLMAFQGFIGANIIFNEDGSITETNSDGQKLITSFNEFGDVVETFIGEKTIRKTTIFNDDGSINEVVL